MTWLSAGYAPSCFPVRFGDGGNSGKAGGARNAARATGSPLRGSGQKRVGRSQRSKSAWRRERDSGGSRRRPQLDADRMGGRRYIRRNRPGERRTEGTTSAAGYFGALPGGGKEVTRLASNLNISAALQGGADLRYWRTCAAESHPAPNEGCQRPIADDSDCREDENEGQLDEHACSICFNVPSANADD